MAGSPLSISGKFIWQQVGFWLICLLAFWGFGTPVAHAQSPVLISGEFENQPLINVLYAWEDEYKVYFSFSHKTIERQRVTLSLNRVPLEQALEKLLAGSELQYEIRKERFVFIQPPDPQKRVCGWLKDSVTGDPIPYAKVWLPASRKGTLSKPDGSFILKGPFVDKDSILISHLGYEGKGMSVEARIRKGCGLIELSAKAMEVPTVNISEYLTDGISYAGWAIHLDPVRVTALPGLSEPDVFRMAEVLPGLSNPDETATGLNLRGGTPDQTLIEYNDIPLFHSGHFFDMISGLNPYGVRSAEVYRSGYGAERNGHVSGLLSLSQGDSLLKEAQYGANLTLTHAGIDIAQPFDRRRGTIFLAARRSIMDFGAYAPAPFEVLQERVFQGSRIWDSRERDEVHSEEILFHDMSLRVLWEPDNRNRIALSGLWMGDRLYYQAVEDEDASNYISTTDYIEKRQLSASLRWDTRVSNRYQISHLISISGYGSSYEHNWEWLDVGNRIFESYARVNNVGDIRFSSRHKWALSPRTQVEAGYEGIVQETGYTLGWAATWDADTTSFSPHSTLHSLYITQQAEIGKKLHAEVGLRGMYQNVLETISWSPRLHLRYAATPELSFRLQAGRYHQFIFQLVEWDVDIYELNPPIWLLAGESGVPPLSANQVSLGGLWDHKDWIVDIEVYKKSLQQLTAISTGINQASPGLFPESTFELDEGTSEIMGLDALVKKRWRKQRTWIAYTLARVLHDFPDVSDEPFRAPQDLRHLLKFIHLAEFGPYELAFGWTYHSGKPFTPKVGESISRIVDEAETPDEEDNEYLIVDPVFGEINSENLRPYHRWDASFMYHFSPEHKRMKLTVGLSAINIWSRENSLSQQHVRGYYDADTPLVSVESDELEKSLLRFLPNILLRIKW